MSDHRPGIASSFVLREVTQSRELRFVARTTCVQCGRAIDIEHGAIMATFHVGGQMLGICCDPCLTPESRTKLQELIDKKARGATAELDRYYRDHAVTPWFASQMYGLARRWARDSPNASSGSTRSCWATSRNRN